MSDANDQAGRLWDLLTEETLFGLTLDERSELRAMASHVSAEEAESIELAAATIWLAGQPETVEPLPPSLIERIREQGRNHLGQFSGPRDHG